MKKQAIRKIVLAYSGGLDTSVICHWLVQQYQAEVVCFCADLGQGEELAGVPEKATRSGASKCYVEDLRAEFARDFIAPMMRSAAIYEGYYLLGTSIARPLIAKRLVEIALKEGADAISHGATGKGNDQVRFELAALALAPQLQVIAPWREWDLSSRTDLLNYVKQAGIPVQASHAKPYSIDANLLHTSYEGGILEDPATIPEEEMFLTTVSPERAPDTPEVVEITFEAGDPVALNGKPLPPHEMLAELNRIGGRNGIGRVDLVENRFVGMKSRGVYETPGGTLWYHAHRTLESITLDREVLHLRDSLIPRYAALVYNGFWFSPERGMLQAAFDHAQRHVTGSVKLKLYKGNVIVAGRTSPVSLYRPDLATFEKDSVYNQADAAGFIRLNALRLKVGAQVQKGHG
ncbi:MAG: argininosuccinate synthase [Nitrospirota bacterium]|nr:argininosuccinate synthase [Nitrospirota bacterium]